MNESLWADKEFIMFVTRLCLLLMARAIKFFKPIFYVYGYGKNDMIEDIRLFDASHNIHISRIHLWIKVRKEGPCNQPWNKPCNNGLLPDGLNDMQIMSAQHFSRNNICAKINEFGSHAKLILGPKDYKCQAK